MTPDQPKEKPEKSGNRRALILAAYNQIAADGFEGLRTRDVADAVGINIGTLHYYFPSKEALIGAVVLYTHEIFARTFPREGSPAEKFIGHLEGLRELLKHDRQLWSVISEIALRAARDEALAPLMQRSDLNWFTGARNLIARGVEQGWLASDLQPDRAAAATIAAIKGLSMQATSTLPPEMIDQTIDQIELWLGLRVDSPPVASGKPDHTT
jgi:AcrR family transcriptional regulator